MANYEDITDLQAVDFALGGVIAGAYENLADNGPAAFRRFLKRPVKKKLFLAKNDDVQSVLRKITAGESDKGEKGPDLPCIVYYREQGITKDQNQATSVIEATRFVSEESVMGMDKAVRLTTIPVTLTYSMLFLAWDRATIDRMALAWWGYIAPLFRKHSRFMVPYKLDGEDVEVPASLISPREALTSSEVVAEDGTRLHGCRTMVEVNTQALYGAAVQVQDYFSVIQSVRVMER